MNLNETLDLLHMFNNIIEVKYIDNNNKLYVVFDSYNENTQTLFDLLVIKLNKLGLDVRCQIQPQKDK
jgi:hypothetical protein